jgi:hypothetical protein
MVVGPWFHRLVADPWHSSLLMLGTWRGIFSYPPALAPSGPAIRGLSTTAAAIGELVAVHGTNFGPNQSSSKVLIGPLDAGAAVSWSETQIQFHVPSGARTGPVKLVVGSAESNTQELAVLPGTGQVEPAAGPTTGGDLVTLALPNSYAEGLYVPLHVLFGSHLAHPLRFVMPGILLVVAPPGSGVVDITVESNGGKATLGQYTFANH